MKHYIYFEGRAAECDTERAFKFALIGKRDPLPEKPPGLSIDDNSLNTIDGRTSDQWSAEERVAVRKFKIATTDKGRYETRVLDWFETMDEATAAFEKWTGWLDLRVVAVATTIP